MKKYCWLNILTGEFSNSWDEESHKEDANIIATMANDEWKLIEFTCLSDDKFEFTQHMKLR